MREISDLLEGEVQDTARRPHNSMYSLVETDDILADLGTSGGNHRLNLFMLANFFDDMRGLHGELSCWHKNESLDLI